MKQTKVIVRVAMCAAMLIAGQIALSAVSGIEIVTVVLLCFCFCYGPRTGVAIATTFSLVRCLYFGFYIHIIVLYLVYYNLFAVFFGWLGTCFTGKMTPIRMGIVVVCAMLFTVCFTLLDDVITPLISGFSAQAAKVYFFQSLYAMIPQTVCTAVTVSLLFIPLTKVLKKINF